MLSLILTQPEARKIHDYDSHVIYRPVGKRGMNLPNGPTLDPEIKAAGFKVSIYQIGRLFWTQEHFRHIYDSVKHETWIQYMADQRMFRECPLKARLEYGPNGIYTAKLQDEMLARCRLEVVGLDVLWRAVVSDTGKPTGLMQWYWAISFVKRDVFYGGK